MATLAEGRSFQASCFSLFEKRRQFFRKVLVTEVPKTELLKRLMEYLPLYREEKA